MLFAYATSAFLIERLFRIVKPKLLTLSWFEWYWTKFVSIRDKIGHKLRNPPLAVRSGGTYLRQRSRGRGGRRPSRRPSR